MHCCRNPLYCVVPPYVLEHMADNAPDPDLRREARETLQTGAAARAARMLFSDIRGVAALSSVMAGIAAGKNRHVFDMGQQTWGLPGQLVRREGDGPVADEAVNEAYDAAGDTYEFYKQQFDRNSLDNNGMTLLLSVHFGYREKNAYWNGQQMLFGDGDGQMFDRFTRSLDVIGHELTHGVVQYEADLEYRQQPGALNEHFADVMGILVEHWRKGRPVAQLNDDDWVIGEEIIAPPAKNSGVTGLRTMTAGKAFEDNPYFGTDPQPKHMARLYTGSADRGGVHINSGIPNHAFYLAAKAIGGNSWEKAGIIWYETLRSLSRYSQFQEAAVNSCRIAGSKYGSQSPEQQAVVQAWKAVGIEVGL
jgi:Zn-dependent metalloprotease